MGVCYASSLGPHADEYIISLETNSKVSFKCQLRSHTPWLHIAKKLCYFEGRKTHFLQIKMNTETKHHVVS